MDVADRFLRLVYEEFSVMPRTSSPFAVKPSSIAAVSLEFNRWARRVDRRFDLRGDFSDGTKNGPMDINSELVGPLGPLVRRR
jgi:hypothetical protein